MTTVGMWWNIVILTYRWGVNTAITGVHEYNAVINSDRQKTRSNINDVSLNYLFSPCDIRNFNSDMTHRIFVWMSISQFKSTTSFRSSFQYLIFYCTGLKFSSKAQLSGPAFALALFEQQNIVSESKTISSFIKIIVCIMKIFFIKIKLFLGMSNLNNYILLYV